MRKITKQAVAAFLNKEEFAKDNTQVSYDPIEDLSIMRLYGNLIAKKHWKGSENLWINLCGWNTPTTRERLNGFPNVSIHTKKGTPYLNGYEMISDGLVAV